jgi:predicted small metal-binding protein
MKMSEPGQPGGGYMDSKKDETQLSGEEGGGGGSRAEGSRNLGSSSGSSESPRQGKKFFVDCSEGDDGCSLKLSGAYDEVLTAACEHARAVHGMKEGCEDDIKKMMKEEGSVFSREDRTESEVSDETANRESPFPDSVQGRGQGQAGTSPGLPS